MAPPSPLHRHQSSLEGILDFSATPPLEADQRLQARQRFYHIINHFEAYPDSKNSSNNQYDRVKLVRLTYEHARSEESKGNFLRAFFQSMTLPIGGKGEDDIDFSDADLTAGLRTSLFGFAEYLFDNFFLPCKDKITHPRLPSIPNNLSAYSKGFY